MKAHLGVDAQSGLVHSVTGTAANVADIAQTHALLHGQEKEAYADAGYLDIEKRGGSPPATRPWCGTWRPSAAKSKRWRKAGSKH